jgi:hypothetical protein
VEDQVCSLFDAPDGGADDDGHRGVIPESFENSRPFISGARSRITRSCWCLHLGQGLWRHAGLFDSPSSSSSSEQSMFGSSSTTRF